MYRYHFSCEDPELEGFLRGVNIELIVDDLCEAYKLLKAKHPNFNVLGHLKTVI